MSKYATSQYSDVIAGIELLNEPNMNLLPGGRDATQSYYQDGYDIVNGATSVVIQDGFASASSWNGFLSGSGGAIIDHHEYQCFTNDLVALTPAQHVSAVSSRLASWGQGQDKFLICGEWSAAMTDCAPAVVCLLQNIHC